MAELDDPQSEEAEQLDESEPAESDIAQVFRAGLASLGRAISLAQDWDGKRVAFRNGLHEALTYWHGIERQDILDECYRVAEAKDLTEHFGIDGIQQDIAEEIVRAPNGKANGPGTGYDYRDEESDVGPAPKAPEPQVEPFPFIRAASFDGQKAPQRRWLVNNRIPMRNVTLLSGDGAVGKTTIIMQLAVAVATTTLDWLQNVIDERGPVMFFTAEEEMSEVHFRLEQIVDYYPDLQWADLKNLHLLSRAEGDCVLAVPHRTQILAKTDHYAQLELSIKQIQPRLVILESAADLFAGNEIDRSQVRKFVSVLRELAIKYDCAIVILSHPSLSGMVSGSGMSGSTQWNNAVRSRMYFKTVRSGKEADESFDEEAEAVKDSGSDYRELQYLKNNRARYGDKIKLVYTNGLFLPEKPKPQATKEAEEAKADEIFMFLLRKFAGDGSGRTVGMRTGTSYAPAIFAKEREAREKRITNTMLASAMERLIFAKKIRSIEYGPPSKLRNKLVVVGSEFDVSADVLPFQQPKQAKPKRARFVSIGRADAGAVCIQCMGRDSDDDVLKIRDNTEIGGQTETLHMKCAEAYFSGNRKDID